MNNIVTKRIEQFINTKFLKTESEITLVTFILKAIESDYRKTTNDSILVAKQIESKQIHILNTIRNVFQDGGTFLKYFNFKNNNIAFSKLNGIKIMSFVNTLDNVKSSDIVLALNNANTKKNVHRKSNFKSKEKNQNRNIQVKIINKKSKELF